MIIIPFILQHAFLVISNVSLLFVGTVLFHVISDTLLHITRSFIRVIYYLYGFIKKHSNVFLNICYLLLFIDIVYLMVVQLETMFLKTMDLHIHL
jgi:hypothetical protein